MRWQRGRVVELKRRHPAGLSLILSVKQRCGQARPIQIEDLRLPLGCWAWEKRTVRTAMAVSTLSWHQANNPRMFSEWPRPKFRQLNRSKTSSLRNHLREA
jgi:hypothetical protein